MDLLQCFLTISKLSAADEITQDNESCRLDEQGPRQKMILDIDSDADGTLSKPQRRTDLKSAG